MSGVRVGNGSPGVDVRLGVGGIRVSVAIFVGKPVFEGSVVGDETGFSGTAVLT